MLRGSVTVGKRLVVLYGAGETGKSRAAAAAPRSNPAAWGERALLVAADPEGGRLGSTLMVDRPNLEVLQLNYTKDIFAQLEDLYLGVRTGKWAVEEGFKTIITDTLTLAARGMLTQLANSQRFSEKHIKMSDSGHMLPMQGDFLAAGGLLDNLIRAQVSGPFNHIIVCHEQEVRPEPGKPGDVYGGPATIGKAAVRQLVNSYNTVIRFYLRPKPRKSPQDRLEMERVAATATHGIWQAKLRTPHPTNPIPEISIETDPVSFWTALDKAEG